jgi:transposase InsO family protein
MKQDVRTLILHCPVCQKLSVKKLDYQTHPFTASTYQPHSRINMDTLVLNQPDKHGNIALIVVIDTFTRWIELYPITDYTAETAATRMLEHFGRYGPPEEILTDRGAQFVNKVVALLCATYGTKFRKNPIAHSHEHSAKVENANRQVLQSLRAFVHEERVMNDWSRALPAIQYIFNTTRHRDIGYTSVIAIRSYCLVLRIICASL